MVMMIECHITPQNHPQNRPQNLPPKSTPKVYPKLTKFSYLRDGDDGGGDDD